MHLGNRSFVAGRVVHGVLVRLRFKSANSRRGSSGELSRLGWIFDWKEALKNATTTLAHSCKSNSSEFKRSQVPDDV